MRLSIIAFSLAVGLIYGAAVLVVALANLIWPDYGLAFLQLAASVYPGYHPDQSIASVITGTCYALVDGTVCGVVFAWLYNLLASRFDRRAS